MNSYYEALPELIAVVTAAISILVLAFNQQRHQEQLTRIWGELFRRAEDDHVNKRFTYVWDSLDRAHQKFDALVAKSNNKKKIK